jgi:Xaa-Pro aminopeptidase
MELAYTARRQRLADRLTKTGVDVAWITGLVNVRYLTGFTGSYAQLLITPEGALFFSDGRYVEQAGNEVSECEIHIFKNTTFAKVLAQLVHTRGWRIIGYEARHLTCESLHKHRIEMRASVPNEKHVAVKWKALPPWVEEQRIIKDQEEIALLKKSSRLIDEAFTQLLPSFQEGVTEREISRRLMNLFWEAGAKGPSFDPIVLFGPRSSLPHGQPSDQSLTRNSWILIDFGALLEGYCSDCTRTFFYGKADSLHRERHHLVMEAYQAGFEKIRPGIPCHEVDRTARQVIETAGLGETFMHGLGHGVGLEIHEAPRLAGSCQEILHENMVVTVEPGIYLAGWGGIRLENAVVVTQDGAEPLTHSAMGIDPWR